MPVASAIAPRPEAPKPKASTLPKVLQLILMLALWIASGFVAAGRLSWARGWICIGAMLGTYAVGGVLVWRRNPAVLKARVDWRHEDTKPFDRVFIALTYPIFMALPIVAGLDAVRYRWSPLPVGTVYLGLVLLELGMAMMMWTLMVNPFAERTVRIQTERNQTVVTTGPYRIVRHPMYVGALALFPGMGLIFGSGWAVGIGALFDVLLVWRTAMEDRLLRRELPGYEEFAAVTRYRLLPGVW